VFAEVVLGLGLRNDRKPDLSFYQAKQHRQEMLARRRHTDRNKSTIRSKSTGQQKHHIAPPCSPRFVASKQKQNKQLPIGEPEAEELRQSTKVDIWIFVLLSSGLFNLYDLVCVWVHVYVCV
jgi:hypothetical protein